MTQIVWDAVDAAKNYQDGVDRGVFASDNYNVDTPTRVWNGLVSVVETPVGSDLTPVYLDGQSYLLVPGTSDYQAVVTAFSSPPYFSEFEGNAKVAPGTYLGQQSKPHTFSFSYRVRSGDGINYQLHIVYGVTATPTSHTFATLGENITPATKSWRFDAIPLDHGGPILNSKPTAHYIVDSATCDPAQLKYLEHWLYGRNPDDIYPEGYDGYFPQTNELFNIVSGVYTEDA